jgi:hypothetical protein
MTTIEIHDGELSTLDSTHEQLSQIPDFKYVNEAGMALAQLDGSNSCLIYGIPDREITKDLAADTLWIANHAYNGDFKPLPINVCRAGASPESVTQLFKLIDNHVNIHGGNSLLILNDLNNMIGATALQPSPAQYRANTKIKSLLDDPRGIKVCAFSTLETDEGNINKPSLGLLAKFAVRVGFNTGMQELDSPGDESEQPQELAVAANRTITEAVAA